MWARPRSPDHSIPNQNTSSLANTEGKFYSNFQFQSFGFFHGFAMPIILKLIGKLLIIKLIMLVIET